MERLITLVWNNYTTSKMNKIDPQSNYAKYYLASFVQMYQIELDIWKGHQLVG